MADDKDDDQSPITDAVTGAKWPKKEHPDPEAPDPRLKGKIEKKDTESKK